MLIIRSYRRAAGRLAASLVAASVALAATASAAQALAIEAPWPANVTFQAGGDCGYFYGEREHRVLGTFKWGDDSKAVDVGVCREGDFGTPVLAPLAGTVVQADTNVAYGKQVVIETALDGPAVRLAHLDSIAVAVNQRVEVGDVLGTLGHSGTGGEPLSNSHLHVACYANRGPNAGIECSPMGGVVLYDGVWVTSRTVKTPTVRVNWVAQDWSGPIIADGQTRTPSYMLTLRNNSTMNLDLRRFHLGIQGDAAFPLPSSDLSGDRNRLPCVDGNGDDGIAGIGETIVCRWTATVAAGAAALFRKVYFDFVDDGGPYGHMAIPEAPWLPVVVQTPANPYPDGLGAQIGGLAYVRQEALSPATSDGWLILTDSAPTGLFRFVLRNTSSLAAIFTDAPGVAQPARLGTVEPARDAASPFLTAGDGYALSTNRVKAESAWPIMPGAAAGFVVRVTKPPGMSPRRTRLALEPVIDGRGWLAPTSQWVPIEIR